jgi:hypothetical protein
MNQNLQDTLVFLAALTIIAEIGCFLFSVYFCTRCPIRWVRNWRRIAWVLWLNVIPIRYGLDVDPGFWQVVLLGHLCLTSWVELSFKWRVSVGADGDRCPGPNEYIPVASIRGTGSDVSAA